MQMARRAVFWSLCSQICDGCFLRNPSQGAEALPVQSMRDLRTTNSLEFVNLISRILRFGILGVTQ